MTGFFDDALERGEISPHPVTMDQHNLRSIGQDIKKELARAAKYPLSTSAHEAYAILLEEVDELWDEVKVKQKNRDVAKMRAEAVQVAAMAIKFVQMVDATGGRR